MTGFWWTEGECVEEEGRGEVVLVFAVVEVAECLDELVYW